MAVIMILWIGNDAVLKSASQWQLKELLTHYRYIAVENIVRKGEIACNKQFLLFSQCFLLYMALIFNSKCNLNCRLQFGPV